MSKNFKIASIMLVSCILLMLSACSIVFAKSEVNTKESTTNVVNSDTEVVSQNKSNLKSMIFNLPDTNKTYRIYMTNEQLENFKSNGLLSKEVSSKSSKDIEDYLKTNYLVEEVK